MPVISQFFGIKMTVYFEQSEHNPPHIHAMYGEYDAEIDVTNGDIIQGDLPVVQRQKVKEWTLLHSSELLNMWQMQKFSKLPPLEK